jgi:HK97 family phage portal protein
MFGALGQRIAAGIRQIIGDRKGVGPTILAAFANALGGSPRPTVNNMDTYLGRYADQAFVYSCIRTIADKGAGVPIKIYKTGKDGKPEWVGADHELQRLIDKVNPFMQGHDLREATHGFYELTGNAYWLLDSMVNGVPTEIYPLNPARVRIVADKEKFIKHYVYESSPGVEGIKFDPAFILHFKTWNPLDDYYGLAPISAAREGADSLMHAGRYNRAFFENSAEPRGILTSEEAISDEADRKAISQAWKEAHQGSAKAHRIAVLQGGMKYQSTASTHLDMAFKDLIGMTREDVLTVYKMPPIMVGLFRGDDSADAKEQRRIFWTDGMVPRFAKFISVINEGLVIPYSDGELFAAYDITAVAELQEDAKLRAETDEIYLRNGKVTINELRARDGQPPVPWGNTWNAPFGLSPITDPRLPPEETPPEEEPTDEEKAIAARVAKRMLDLHGKGSVTECMNCSLTFDFAKEPEVGMGWVKCPNCGKVVDQEGNVRKDAAKERRAVVWAEFKGFTEQAEGRWKPILRNLFSDQEREVIRNLGDHWAKALAQKTLDATRVKQSVDVILFDEGEARKVFRKEGLRLLTATLNQRARAEQTRYGLGDQFNLSDPHVQTWLDARAFRFAKEVNDTTLAELRDELKAAIDSGEAIDDVEKRIERVFDLARGFRTERIARTEVVSASNAGAVLSYEQSGRVQRVEWVSSRDAQVRESHEALDGQAVGLNAQFSNGLKYPGDPAGQPAEVINCRCTIAPVVSKEDE